MSSAQRLLLTVRAGGSIHDSIRIPEYLEVGRQQLGEPDPYTVTTLEERQRLIVADLDERTIPRRAVLLRDNRNLTVEVTNLSDKSTVRLLDGRSVPRGKQETFEVPFGIRFGSLHIWLEEIKDSGEFQTLSHRTMVPGSVLGVEEAIRSIVEPTATIDHDTLRRLLRLTIGIIQTATVSADFLADAASAVTQILGLERALVLMLEGGRWSTKACSITDENAEFRHPSYTVLDRVHQQRRTHLYYPDEASVSESLASVSTVVAAPILTAESEVVGVLYADQSVTGDAAVGGKIGNVEATFVELIACGVASGLARLRREQEAMSARIQFEQFFTSELAQELERQPDLLEPKDTEVTILSCDIRGFSRIAEHLGPGQTMDWISEVLDDLSSTVLDFNGVVVDYVGDELLAMWGAPGEQPEHARLACSAAIEIVIKAQKLAESWSSILGEHFQIGIGINSGIARVGNTGSKRKFKYGPLGNTVNAGSRVQGVNKLFGSTILITEDTFNQLTDLYSARRLCKARLFNIEQPVDLYELENATSVTSFDVLKERYQEALSYFEQSDFLHAAERLGSLVADFPEDGATRQLIARNVELLVDPPASFDGVWEFEK